MPDNEKKCVLEQIGENPKQVIPATTRSDLYDNFVTLLMTSTNPSLNSF